MTRSRPQMNRKLNAYLITVFYFISGIYPVSETSHSQSWNTDKLSKFHFEVIFFQVEFQVSFIWSELVFDFPSSEPWFLNKIGRSSWIIEAYRKSDPVSHSHLIYIAPRSWIIFPSRVFFASQDVESNKMFLDFSSSSRKSFSAYGTTLTCITSHMDLKSRISIPVVGWLQRSCLNLLQVAESDNSKV